MAPSALEIISAARAKGIYRENPKLSDLPEWVMGFRDHQRTAITEAVDAFNDVDLVLIDAPTGSGKTLIGEAIGRLLLGNRIYVCHGKGLQDQFLRDFPMGKLLKGKSNYYPDGKVNPEGPNCEDCDGSLCSYCPYSRAKTEALASSLAVLNTSYLLAECNGPGRFHGRDLVVVDEADTLEKELLNHVSILVSSYRMKKYGLKAPDKVTVQDSWIEWVGHAKSIAMKHYSPLVNIGKDDRTREETRELRWLENFYTKCALLEEGLASNSWIYDGKKDSTSIIFKPITVNQLGPRMLWQHGKKFLLMSATLISSQEMVDSLGWERDYHTVSVPNTFPIKNRPVIIMRTANMTRKADEDGGQTELMLSKIKELVTKHPDEKILIHTVSYQRTEQVVKALKESSTRKVYTYGKFNGIGREQATEAWKKAISPAIMVAPSLDRGVDLPGDLCRVQIIAKIPYPFLGDRQVSARKYSRNGATWYAVQTIRTIVQMTGRAVRNKDDHAVTYILDSSFDELWSSHKRLFPPWWRESVIWEAR